MKWPVVTIAFLLICISAHASEQTSAFGYLTNLVSHKDMEPTLEKGDRIASDPNYYTHDKIRRGDIVIFASPKKNGAKWVKRVVGLPGETVEAKKGKILINGKELVEPYVQRKNTVGISSSLKKSHEVPADCYYVLGDNRDISMDSRYFGPIKRESIFAKVVNIYLSPKISRIGRLIEPVYP